ncbi:diguanylate cyclase [Photobacterium sp. 2_MG-2023]|uniref:sensor domain-containing diguanylate cyclase n=1 Tax=Photobacterium sp. 2_MG-2023 TaxID=3062663 RepID=UPI0026E1644A|nr:diguanylate cyclase [Photobacterium sp. 2_MG-2023]MDO6583406.1 diguanylate cyclase [Photobacterium sp. 2_MG-2023]
MPFKLNDELDKLVDTLARQANMERWCHRLLSTLHHMLDLTYLTLLVEHEGQSKVLASWMGNEEFKYYLHPLPLSNYNGVPADLLLESKQSRKAVSAQSATPFKAIWTEQTGDWRRVIFPIIMHEKVVAYLYAETPIPERLDDNLKAFERVLLLIASDISVHMLREEALTHNISRRSVEAELEVRNYSLREYLSLLKQLHEVTLALAESNDLDCLYRTAIELGRQKLGIDRLAIFLTDMQHYTMQGTYGTDPQGNVVSRRTFVNDIPDHPLVHEALSRKDVVVVKENAPLYYGTQQVGTGWNAMISMWNSDNCIGWIAADNLISQRSLTDHQKEIMKLFGAALGQQIVIKQSHEALTKLNAELEQRVHLRTQELQQTNKALEDANRRLEAWSMQDGLTGVANRRFFDLTLKRYWQVAKRKQLPLSIIILDVDHFKSFNDTYGHQRGDVCLKQVAVTLDNIVNRYEKAVFSRYGGEEFVCLVPEMDAETLRLLAEEMLDAVNQLKIPHSGTRQGVISISMGLYSRMPTENIQEEVLLAGADQGLYLAKQGGRNQYFQWDENQYA